MNWLLLFKMMKNNNYYVYIYLDPRKPGWFEYGDLKFIFEPIYIGKGKKNRIDKHLQLYNKKINYRTKFYNTINKIYQLGLEPIRFKLEESLLDKEAKYKEVELIKLLGRKDLKTGTLLNLTDGGEGVTNHIPTELQRTHSGVYKKGYKISKEMLEKRRLGKIGKSLTEEHRISCSKAKGGLPILQYSLKGEFIKEWKIMNDAAKAGFKKVDKAFRLKSRMSYGYLWIKKTKDIIDLNIEPYKVSNKSPNKYKNI